MPISNTIVSKTWADRVKANSASIPVSKAKMTFEKLPLIVFDEILLPNLSLQLFHNIQSQKLYFNPK